MLPARRRAMLIASGTAALIVIGLLTYGFVLRLPFFSDDMAHARFLQSHDLPGIWRTAWGLGYYRPLPATLWKILALIERRYDPLAFHALNLVLHLLNAALVFALAGGMGQWKGMAFGLAAALLFLVYPFSYQAVPWVGSLTHLLVTSLILGSLLLHRAGISRRSRSLLALSIALALLAPFAHETGVLAAPLLLLMLAAERQVPPRTALLRTVPYWACAVLGLGVWMLVPKGASPAGLGGLDARWQNAVYLAQGLAYPVAPLALRVMTITARLDRLQATALVTGGAIAAWGLLLARAGRGRIVALAVTWFALAAAPAWASLEPEYVQSGPRLLYLASVGAAIFWSVPADLAWPRRRSARFGPALAVLVIVSAAASAYRFIRARVPLYEQTRLAATQLVAARPRQARGSLLCVNYPMWFALRTPGFAVGSEGVVFVPRYSSVADLLWAHTGEERPVTSVVFADLLPRDSWKYVFPCIGEYVDGGTIQAEVRRAAAVAVARYDGENVAVLDAGGLEGVGRPPADEYLAALAGRLVLLSGAIERYGQSARIELRWQCLRPPVEETTVFVHLYDPAGRLVTQADGYPVMGTSRLVAWQAGDEWRDVRLLALPDGLSSGAYTVKVGLYPVQGGPRLPATSATGQRYADDAVPIGSLALPG